MRTQLTQTTGERTRLRISDRYLIKMYGDAKKARKQGRLDFRVRTFCEELKHRNAGQLPKPKGGRPTAEHRRLLIAMHVRESIEALGKIQQRKPLENCL